MIQGFHCCWPAAVSGLTIRRSYLIYVRIEKVFERMDAIVNYRGVLLFLFQQHILGCDALNGGGVNK